jgi:hypothetical protein
VSQSQDYKEKVPFIKYLYTAINRAIIDSKRQIGTYEEHYPGMHVGDTDLQTQGRDEAAGHSTVTPQMARDVKYIQEERKSKEQEGFASRMGDFTRKKYMNSPEYRSFVQLVKNEYKGRGRTKDDVVRMSALVNLLPLYIMKATRPYAISMGMKQFKEKGLGAELGEKDLENSVRKTFSTGLGLVQTNPALAKAYTEWHLPEKIKVDEDVAKKFVDKLRTPREREEKKIKEAPLTAPNAETATENLNKSSAYRLP